MGTHMLKIRTKESSTPSMYTCISRLTLVMIIVWDKFANRGHTKVKEKQIRVW